MTKKKVNAALEIMAEKDNWIGQYILGQHNPSVKSSILTSPKRDPRFHNKSRSNKCGKN